MMRSTMRNIGIAIGVTCLAGGLAIAAPAANGVRAGDLALRLARAAGAPLPPSAAERAAADYLAARGIVLGPSLEALVREGDLVEAARVVGAVVASSQPASPITPAQGAAFVGALRGAVAAENNGNGQGGVKEGGINASCQGREARSGRNGTPASPADPNATAPPCGSGNEPKP